MEQQTAFNIILLLVGIGWASTGIVQARINFLQARINKLLGDAIFNMEEIKCQHKKNGMQ